MFTDIYAKVVDHQNKLNKLQSDNLLNSSKEIELRIEKYNSDGDNRINFGDFMRARTHLDHLAKDNPQWSVTEVTDIVIFQQAQTGIQNPEGTKSNWRKIRLGKTEQHVRKISILDQGEYTAIKSTVFPFRIAFSLEVTVSATQSQTQSRDRSRKSYTYKEGTEELFRVDTTIVTEQNGTQLTRTNYEIEIELLADIVFTDPALESRARSNIEIKLEWITSLLMRIVNETKLIYSHEELKLVTKAINQMLLKKSNVPEVYVSKRKINKPQDMTWNHLRSGTKEGIFQSLITEDDSNAPTNYTVTVKLDGVRMLVFFDERGIFLFNPFARIICKIHDQVIPELIGTILDAELILEPNETLSTAKLFEIYVFDCIFIGGTKVRDVRNFPHGERFKGVARAIKYNNRSNIWTTESNLFINAKVFYPFNNRESFYHANIQALAKVQIYKKGNLVNADLGHDGLIYTHTGLYLEEAQTDKGVREVSKNIRWKPPSQLTIDFLIRRIDQVPTMMIGKENARGKWTNTPFRGTFEYRLDPTAVVTSSTVRGMEVTIGEEQVGEFRYDFQNNRFYPIRLRTDKTEPNRFEAARDTWNLIQDPILPGIITSNIQGKKALKLMREFHGRVKATELAKIAKEVKTDDLPRLFDIGSSYGGDVKKWKFNNFRVFALEPDEERVKELKERVDKHKIGDRVDILQGRAENISGIMKKFRNLKFDSVDAVSMFHSLTFFYDYEESVNALLQLIMSVLRPGGVFICIAMDGDLIWREMGKSVQVELPGIKIRKLKDADGVYRRKVQVTLKTKDFNLRTGQTEFLVDFDHFISRFESNGFEVLDDRLLNSDVVLNDSELWWSQMTRLVKFRYVGIENKESENLNRLKSILMDARITMLGADVRQEFNVSDIGFGNYKLWTVGVYGDGSCFLHSILYCINLGYRKMSKEDRVKMVAGLRRDLSRLFTPETYENLSKGSIKELGSDASTFSYETLKANLLRYQYSFGAEFLEFVSNKLDINISIVWHNNGKIVPYKTASDIGTIYKEGRNTIVLFWQGGNHYQPVGRMQGESLEFVFEDTDQMSKSLR